MLHLVAVMPILMHATSTAFVYAALSTDNDVSFSTSCTCTVGHIK